MSSYKEVIVEAFLKGGVAFVFLALCAYRLMATLIRRRAIAKWLYLLLCLAILAISPLLPLFNKGVGIVSAVFMLFLFAPIFVSGAIQLAREWRWQHVLLSCVIETVWLSLWFVSLLALTMLVSFPNFSGC